jgi:hypothetical protein
MGSKRNNGLGGCSEAGPAEEEKKMSAHGRPGQADTDDESTR